METVADRHRRPAYDNEQSSTHDELLRSVDINDLEPPKYGFLVTFLVISGCDTHFQSEFRVKLLIFYCMLYTDCQSASRELCSNYLYY